MHSPTLFMISFLFNLCPSWAWTWSCIKYRRTLIESTSVLTQLYDQQPPDDANNSDILYPNNKDNDKFQNAEYGVSYIGGDPCGSKYNDDPFDAANNRSTGTAPGFPMDMKKRIEAMAEQIKQQKEEQKEQ